MAFKDTARFYTIEGHELVSVTTAISIVDKSAPLMHWSANQERRVFQTALLNVLADKTKTRDQVLDAVIAATSGTKAFLKEQDEAAVIGTALHAWCEWRTRQMLGEKVGDEPEIPDAAMISVEAWKDWVKTVDFTPVMAERVVFCTSCGYAGTLDWVAKVRGVLTLGDYKTSKAIYAESLLQNQAYRHAARRCGIETDQGMVLRLPKTLDDLKAAQPFEAMVVPEIPQEDFLAVKRAWEWKRRMEGKRVGR